MLIQLSDEKFSSALQLTMILYYSVCLKLPVSSKQRCLLDSKMSTACKT